MSRESSRKAPAPKVVSITLHQGLDCSMEEQRVSGASPDEADVSTGLWASLLSHLSLLSLSSTYPYTGLLSHGGGLLTPTCCHSSPLGTSRHISCNPSDLSLPICHVRLSIRPTYWLQEVNELMLGKYSWEHICQQRPMPGRQEKLGRNPTRHPGHSHWPTCLSPSWLPDALSPLVQLLAPHRAPH